MRTDSLKDKLIIVLNVLLVIVLGVLWYFSNERDRASMQALQAETDIAIVEEEKDAEEKRIAEVAKKQEEIRTKVLASIEQNIQGIICWGDGLTAGSGGNGTNYPSVLRNEISEKIVDRYYNVIGVDAANPADATIEIPVINMGVGGENSITIAGRCGAIPFVTNKDLTVPDTTEAIPIEIVSSNGMAVSPLRQGVVGMEYVTIDGIEGVMEVIQESPVARTFSYTFRRSEAGEAKDIPKGTPIITSGSKFKNYIPVIFIGQNGGYDSLAQLIEQQRAIIAGQTQTERFIVLGLTTGTAANRVELESAMKAEYGDKYINLREYLCTDGLKDAELDPTSEDIAAIAVGSVPPSLRSNDIDLNEVGYTFVAKKIYAKMDELGYFKEINEAIGEDDTL